MEQMESQTTALASLPNPLRTTAHQLTLPGVVKLDPWLAPFKESLKARYSNAQKWIKKIDETEGGLEKFSRVGPPRVIQFQPLTIPGLREVWH
jgi:hypothetical protein